MAHDNLLVYRSKVTPQTAADTFSWGHIATWRDDASYADLDSYWLGADVFVPRGEGLVCQVGDPVRSQINFMQLMINLSCADLAPPCGTGTALLIAAADIAEDTKRNDAFLLGKVPAILGITAFGALYNADHYAQVSELILHRQTWGKLTLVHCVPTLVRGVHLSDYNAQVQAISNILATPVKHE